MTRYFFKIAYRGTNYFGWQRQPKAISVQEVLENELRKLYGEQIAIVGCGRTDTGVHASAYYFHTDIDQPIQADKLIFKLNRMLPADIVIFDIFEVSSELHARFDATSRTYHYFIHTFKSPFLEGLSTYVPQPLDIQAMNDAAKKLLGTKDFTSFSKLHTDVKTNFCSVTAASWTRLDNGQLRFEITANRFLRNMVRAIVGTLIEVGLGKITSEEVNEIIERKDRQEAGKSVPAHGLYLAEIFYSIKLESFID